MKESGNRILDLSFDFALQVVSFSEELEVKRRYVIANQILRSGTSIGANVREAQNSESKADFLHKLKIAAKEAEETKYWLLLCKHSKNYSYNDQLFYQLKEIQKLLNSIICSVRKRMRENA